MSAIVFHDCGHTSCVSCVSSDGAAGPRLNNNQLYKFSYTTEVLVDMTRGSKEGSTGYRISSDVAVNLVWRDPSSKDDQLIQLAVRWSTRALRAFLFKLAVGVRFKIASFHVICQISNVRIEPATPRSEKSNVLHDSTAEIVLGKTKLAALSKPFLVHLRNGKVRSLPFS